MKDLDCVKSYVDSKWETILDWTVIGEQFDLLLELIECYKIPMERYIHNKGELIVCYITFIHAYDFLNAFSPEGSSDRLLQQRAPLLFSLPSQQESEIV